MVLNNAYDPNHMITDTGLLSDFFSNQGEPFELAAKSALFRQSDSITRLYWLKDGQARLVRRSLEGQEITLQSLSSGLIAEASLYQDYYHCDGLIEQDSVGFQANRNRFEEALSASSDLHHAFSRYLASNLREARAISEIKSLKRIAERVDAWIALKGPDSLRKGELTGVAAQIGVTREALYRELSRRK